MSEPSPRRPETRTHRARGAFCSFWARHGRRSTTSCTWQRRRSKCALPLLAGAQTQGSGRFVFAKPGRSGLPVGGVHRVPRTKPIHECQSLRSLRHAMTLANSPARTNWRAQAVCQNVSSWRGPHTQAWSYAETQRILSSHGGRQRPALPPSARTSLDPQLRAVHQNMSGKHRHRLVTPSPSEQPHEMVDDRTSYLP